MLLQDAAVCLVILSTTSPKLKNDNILTKTAAKCLSKAVHLGLDQGVDVCACGWEITLSACGGVSTVNNVIRMAYIISPVVNVILFF
jgi:hypothetical protein